MHFVGDISKDFQKDPVSDKCNLNPGTEEVSFGNNKSVKLENDSKDYPRAVVVKTKYRKSNDDQLKKGIETVQEGKFILSSISVTNDTQSENVEKISFINKNGYAFGPCSEVVSEITPYDIKKSNYVISSEDREKIFLGKESSKRDEEIKFPDNHKSNCVESDLSIKIKENKASKNRVHFNDEVKTFTYEPLLSVIENFPSDQELIKANTYMDFINDKYVKKSKNGRQLRRRNKSCITHKFLTADIHNAVSIDRLETKRRSNRIMSRDILREKDDKESSPLHNNKKHGKVFTELIKENTLLYMIKDEEIEESTYDHQRRRLNQTSSNPEFPNAEIDHIHFIDKVKHNIQPKDVMPRHDFLKKENVDSSSINKNDNPDKRVPELVKGNTPSDVTEHVKVEESKCVSQHDSLNQDCNNPEFSNIEVDHINFIDKVEPNRRPKLSLSRHVFRKNKIEDSPSINMNDNPEKRLSELVKGNTLSDVFKYVELEESKYGCLRPRLNQSCSNPEFSNTEVDHINFTDKVEPNRRPKLSLSRHVCRKNKIEDSPSINMNDNPEKPLSELVKGNTLSDVIKHVKVEASKWAFQRRCPNQDCSNPEFSNTEVDNINFTDKAEPNRRPKLSLYRHVFRKNKIEENPSINMNDNPEKRLSEFVKGNTLSDVFKYVELEESKYGCLRPLLNQPCNNPEFSNVEGNHVNFIHKAKHNRRPKLSPSRHVFESKKIENGSTLDDNENPGKRLPELIKENILTYMIKDEEVRESNYDLRRCRRNQDSSLQKFSNGDIVNTVFIGKEDPKRWPKLILPRHNFQKEKTGKSSLCDKNENADKRPSELIKENAFMDVIKDEKVEESKYGLLRQRRNQCCGIQEFSTADIDTVFIGNVEHKRCSKLSLPHRDFLKTKSEDSSQNDRNENPDKQSCEFVKENALCNEEVEESKCGRQCLFRNQGCSIREISTVDVDNNNFIDKVEPSRRPKLRLSRQLFRKKNTVDSSLRAENENSAKELSETNSKNTFADMIKNGEIKESNYDRQRWLRNHCCSIQESSTHDIDNIGKVERKKRPKLFCPHFRNKKSVGNSPP